MSTPRGNPPEIHPTGEAVLEAALQAFYERGYNGASIRSIAAGAGIAVATLFHYFPSKASILERIVNGAADAMQDDLDAVLAGHSDPLARLRAAMRTLVVASCDRQRESFVAQSEFRSLGREAFDLNREKRRRIQSVFSTIVDDGIASGRFASRYPSHVARSLVVLGTAVALWFEAGQGLSPEQVAEAHVEMAVALVGADAVAPIDTRSDLC